MGLCYLLQPSDRPSPNASVEPGPKLYGSFNQTFIVKLTWKWLGCCGDYTEAKLWRRTNPTGFFAGDQPFIRSFPFSGPGGGAPEFTRNGFAAYQELASFDPSQDKDWYVGPQTSLIFGQGGYWQDYFALTLRACGDMWILANGLWVNWARILGGGFDATPYLGYSNTNPPL